MRLAKSLWRGSGPGLAVGGALLLGLAQSSYVMLDGGLDRGSWWLLAAGVAGLVAVAVVTHAENRFRAWTVPWLAAGAGLAGAAVAARRWPDEALGPAWPVALVGFLATAVGFALLALRSRAAAPPPASAVIPGPVVVAAVMALVVLIGTPLAGVTWLRHRAADVRVGAVPADPPAITGAPGERWRVRVPFRGEVVTGGSVPVLHSRTRIAGLDPVTGETRWWVRHGDREVTRVAAWNDRVLVSWEVHRALRGTGGGFRRSLVDARTGRILAEADDSRETFVGDRMVRLPAGCVAELLVPTSGLWRCGSRIVRVDGRGNERWSVEQPAGYIAHAGAAAVLVIDDNNRQADTVALDPDSGAVLWSAVRNAEPVGVTDGVGVWRQPGDRTRPVVLTGIDVRTGGVRWTRDLGFPVYTSDPFLGVNGGYVDVVHGAPDRRVAVTRLSARDGTESGPDHEFDLGSGSWPAARPTGSVLVLETPTYLFGIG